MFASTGNNRPISDCRKNLTSGQNVLLTDPQKIIDQFQSTAKGDFING